MDYMLERQGGAFANNRRGECEGNALAPVHGHALTAECQSGVCKRGHELSHIVKVVVLRFWRVGGLLRADES